MESAQEFAEVTGDTDSLEKFNDIINYGAKEAVDFSNTVTDNYDQITEVFDNNFNVLNSAMTETGGVSEQYRSLIGTIVESSAAFYARNEEAATYMATALYEDLGETEYSIGELRGMLQSGSAELTDALMNDASATGTMMSGTVNQTQAAIASMASGISGLISGMMQMLSSVNGNIEGEPVETSGKTFNVEGVDSTGQKSTVQMHVPGFNLRIKGNGSSSGGSSGGE